MGLDTSAMIVVGAKIDYERKKVKVKKYDQDTGKPFYREENKHVWSVEGIELADDEWDDWERLRHSGDSEDYTSYFIGITPVETGGVRDNDKLWAEINPAKIADWKIEAEEKIKKAIGVDVIARVYLLQYISY